MKKRARETLSQLAMGSDRLSSHFLRHHGRRERPVRGRRIGIVSFLCALSVLAPPLGEAPDVSASLKPEQPVGHTVTVTAYTNLASLTDSTPNETASLLKIRPEHYGRVIALSPDLARKYKFGDKFHLVINGEKHLVEFQDVMAKRHKNRTDFLLASRKKCVSFGVTQGVLIPLGDRTEPPRKAERR